MSLRIIDKIVLCKKESSHIQVDNRFEKKCDKYSFFSWRAHAKVWKCQQNNFPLLIWIVNFYRVSMAHKSSHPHMISVFNDALLSLRVIYGSLTVVHVDSTVLQGFLLIYTCSFSDRNIRRLDAIVLVNEILTWEVTFHFNTARKGWLNDLPF